MSLHLCRIVTALLDYVFNLFNPLLFSHHSLDRIEAIIVLQYFQLLACELRCSQLIRIETVTTRIASLLLCSNGCLLFHLLMLSDSLLKLLL